MLCCDVYVTDNDFFIELLCKCYLFDFISLVLTLSSTKIQHDVTKKGQIKALHTVPLSFPVYSRLDRMSECDSVIDVIATLKHF